MALSLILFSATVGATELTQRGTEKLVKLQHTNGGFITPIETSTILYNAQMVYMYKYLGLMNDKKERVDGLIRYMQAQQNKGLSIYEGGEEQLPILKTVMLAYHLAGLEKSSSYLDAQKKIESSPKGADDFFTAPYFMIFGLDRTANCIPPGIWQWFNKRDKRVPWIKVLANPVIFLLETNGIQPTQNWPLAIQKRPCRKINVSDKKLKIMARDYYTWFKSYVERDGTLFDYVPTTIPNLMALHHAKKFLPELAKEIDQQIKASIETLEKFQVTKENGLKQSPGEGSIAETVEMIFLMIESGYSIQNPRLAAAIKFLLERQNKNGGWGFSSYNTHFQDPDGTGLVLSLLNELQKKSPRADIARAIQKALDWLKTWNNSDGGFASWERKQDMLPGMGILTGGLAKRGLILTQSLEEATSRVLIGMAPHKNSSPEVHRSWKLAIKWLMKRQKEDGTFSGTWMIGPQFGTVSAITALSTAIGDESIDQKKLMTIIERGVEFIQSSQQMDGSFGDHPRTYETGKPEPLSTPSPAFTGIIASRLVIFNKQSRGQWSDVIMPMIQKSAELLKETQNENGLWDDQTWTAVTFPKIEYAQYPFIQQLEGLRVLIYAKESSGTR